MCPRWKLSCDSSFCRVNKTKHFAQRELKRFHDLDFTAPTGKIINILCTLTAVALGKDQIGFVFPVVLHYLFQKLDTLETLATNFRDINSNSDGGLLPLIGIGNLDANV